MASSYKSYQIDIDRPQAAGKAPREIPATDPGKPAPGSGAPTTGNGRGSREYESVEGGPGGMRRSGQDDARGGARQSVEEPDDGI